MLLQNDNDVVRGLGFVALYAAYLEEQIDSLLFMLDPVEPFPESEQRWPIGRKIGKAIRLINKLEFDYKDSLLEDLNSSRKLFEWRNEVIHGRIYANFDKSDILRAGRPNMPDREITAEELYMLANNFAEARSAIYRPMILQIPKVLQARSNP